MEWCVKKVPNLLGNVGKKDNSSMFFWEITTFYDHIIRLLGGRRGLLFYMNVTIKEEKGK